MMSTYFSKAYGILDFFGMIYININILYLGSNFLNRI